MTEQVEVKSSSIATVALKITDRIAQAEEISRTDGEYRKKYLDLYAECHEAVSGYRSKPK